MLLLLLLLRVLLVLLLLKVLVVLLRQDGLWVVLTEHLGSLVCVVLLLLGPSRSAWYDARCAGEGPPTYCRHNCGVSVLVPRVRVRHGTTTRALAKQRNKKIAVAVAITITITITTTTTTITTLYVKSGPGGRTGMSDEKENKRAAETPRAAWQGLGQVELS